jgi:hypothetical protein
MSGNGDLRFGQTAATNCTIGTAKTLYQAAEKRFPGPRRETMIRSANVVRKSDSP